MRLRTPSPESSSHSPVSNVIRLVLASAGVQGLAFLALPLLQRWCYGPEDFADFALYSQWAGLFGAVATVRMDLAVVKHDTPRLASAAFANGLRALLATVCVSFIAVLGFRWTGSAMGDVDGLWFWLPVGVAGLGAGNLGTAWLTRQEHFGLVARVRAMGGALGEGLRFAFSGLAGSGLIAGRVVGQWLTAGMAIRHCLQNQVRAERPTREERIAAWKIDRDYVRYTTPANLLAMGANALLVLFLFESAPRDTVGQVGAAAAYLTVAFGLVIRGTNDVFFRLLNDIPDSQLTGVYIRWALSLIGLATAGATALYLLPLDWVILLLGERWSDLLPVMRMLCLWMIPWVAASSLSGIFPHLRRQSWSLVLDVLHLCLIGGWLIWFSSTQGPIGQGDWTIIKQYTWVQSGFYSLALCAGVSACMLGTRTTATSGAR